jgi:cell wall assembly regulator SMI1
MAIAGVFGTAFQEILPMTDDLTMSATQASYNIVVGTSGLSGGKTLTLPQVKQMVASQNLWMAVANKAASGGTITIAAFSGDSIVGTATLAAGGTGLLFRHDGLKTWYST